MKNKPIPPVAQDYLKEISSLLEFPRSQKTEVLEGLQELVEDFCQEQGHDITMNLLIDRFGAPRDVADEYLQETDSGTIRKALSHKRKLFLLILSCCLLVVLLVVGYLAWDNWRKEQMLNGYVVETVSVNSDSQSQKEPIAVY